MPDIQEKIFLNQILFLVLVILKFLKGKNIFGQKQQFLPNLRELKNPIFLLEKCCKIPSNEKISLSLFKKSRNFPSSFSKNFLTRNIF